MIIIIPTKDLEPKFKETPSNITCLWNLGIDYMTNTINGIIEGKEYVVFYFDNYGIKTDNRFNTYSIAKSESGIFIEITSTK